MEKHSESKKMTNIDSIESKLSEISTDTGIRFSNEIKYIGMKNNLHIVYRLSDMGENKERLDCINNKSCLENFLQSFAKHFKLHIITKRKNSSVH